MRIVISEFEREDKYSKKKTRAHQSTHLYLKKENG
jgi:hypothetical protein